MEPRVQERVEVLLKDLRVKSAGGMVAETDEYGFGNGWKVEGSGHVVFDIRPWLNMLSYDAITAMFWSNTYGELGSLPDMRRRQSEVIRLPRTRLGLSTCAAEDRST